MVLTGIAWQDGALQRRQVVRCALSRVCGVCGEHLGRPIAFLGDAEEVARNTFHLPPLHAACAHDLGPDASGLQVVLTSGFEFVRPGREDLDPEPRFVPNSLL